ncbi:DNA-binding transcriptional ArsR family regulator [Saccharothrix tamanrassetensis]|uniref:DNA-binding transcriptional ArsR family regulator n=1 Tax=Saccharothrix tamanrassetensis TaxID=1051531 RepID=A0A841CF50_9PSEU|nr:helix-turn-helix domain-containing protein [Saccharothrix tamanrassetensis]MBB5954994.1 DNA-binding transcriptional ArsR family regulator [Saccharothrix tamanrassetensis]
MKAVLPHPARDEMRIEAVLHALADPVRLRIVRALAECAEGISCGLLDLGVTASTLTHHVRTLREAGVVHVTPRGTSRISTLRREDLDALYPGLLDGVLAAPR